MKSRLLSYLLITAAIGGLLIQGFVSGHAQYNHLIWNKPDKIVAKTKPGRKKSPTRLKPNNKGEEVAPLLTLKYRLLEREDNGPPTRVNPAGSFEVADQLKLAITVNQNGFLYIVHNSNATDGAAVDPLRIVFPDPRINNGQNVVEKDKEIMVPGSCAEYDNPADCWWEITAPAGHDYFTLIFSRDEINAFENLKAGSPVDQSVINNLKSQSGQKLARADKISFDSLRKEESDGTYVQNTNLKDNEELIETIKLSHLKETADDGLARTRALFVKKRADAMRVNVLQELPSAGAKKELRPVVANQEFREGERLKLRFQSNFEGFVYVLNITPDGKKRLIYPCSGQDINTIIPGRIYYLPADDDAAIEFDADKGTEVLQVIMSRDRIAFLEDVLKTMNCCNSPKPCDLTDSASAAAAELAGTVQVQQQSSMDAGGVDAGSPPPQDGASGVRSRGIKLASGKDKDKSTYVAIQDNVGQTLKQGQVAVFYVRLKHI